MTNDQQSAPPALMTAVLLTGIGGYEKLELRHDVPVPVLGPGEVLIRVSAAGVNNTDVNLRIGWYADNAAQDDTAKSEWNDGAITGFPRIQGVDVCGHIVAVGEEVEPARIGERVLINPILRDPAHYLGSDWDGGFAEYTKVPSRNALRIESDLSDVELASIPCSYGTAAHLISRSAVAAGETVLVTGASGGVGSAVVQLARLRGARVIAMASADKAAQLAALGADQVLDRDGTTVETLGREAVDVVIDLVGGPGWPALLAVMKPRGRYATSGAIAGPVVPLDLRTLYFKDLTLIGCTFYEDHVFLDLIKKIETGKIKPVVAAIFPLHRIAEAQETFIQKRHVGKIVLEICNEASGASRIMVPLPMTV